MQFFDLFFVESPRVNSETIFRLNSLENAGKKHLVPADPEKNILLKFHFVLEPPQIDWNFKITPIWKFLANITIPAWTRYFQFGIGIRKHWNLKSDIIENKPILKFLKR